MEQVNVLHVIDHMGMGGAQRIVGELFRKWDDENIRLFYFSLRESKNTIDLGNGQVFFSSRHKSRYNLSSFFELIIIIRSNHIKILHLHLAKSNILGILLKLFYFKDIKIIVHEHGEIFQNKFWYNNFLKIFQNKVDLFIAVSEATKRMLFENAEINGNKIKVLYNFVDLNKINPDKIKNSNRTFQRMEIGINKDDFVIGFAGRLDKIKGCDLFIRSIPYIQIKNFKLLIAGDGPEKRHLEILTKEINVEDKVHFCGYIKNILKFYGLIDCFVLPSRSEASPMAFYEIQALGIPLIANDVLALNEFIIDKENGLLFQTNNERDLAEKISLVYNNSELRAQMIGYGIDNIKKYSLNTYINELNIIYKNLFN